MRDATCHKIIKGFAFGLAQPEEECSVVHLWDAGLGRKASSEIPWQKVTNLQCTFAGIRVREGVES
jgi:hypothetical protein